MLLQLLLAERVCVSVYERERNKERGGERVMVCSSGHLSGEVLKPNFAKVFRQAITRSTYQST